MSLPGTLTVPQNSALALTATVSPGNAISKNVIWSVSGGSAALYTDADCTQPLGAGASDTLTVYVKGLAVGEATVTVTATNGTDDTLDDFSAVCAVTVAASAEITYELHDSYGDGWNGAYILVTDQETGAEITRLTVSGSDASGSFTTVPGRAIVFTWVSGSYDYECTYSLSCDGAEIFSGSDAMGAPVVYTPIVCDHELSAVSAVEPGCTQPGTAAHYHCTICGQNFSDAEGTVRVTDAALTVPAAPDTSYAHFTGVEIDNVPLVRDTDYTDREGSTVVTLKPATLQGLSLGGHTVTLLFDNGRVNTNLTVQAPPAPGSSTSSPATGDESSAALWFALLLFSGAGLAGSFSAGKCRARQ